MVFVDTGLNFKYLLGLAMHKRKRKK